MSVDLMKFVTETENMAAEIRKKSHEDGKGILAAAEAEGLKLLNQTLEEAKKEREVIDERSRKAAELQVEGIRAQVYEECRIINENALKISDQIADKIVERIVNKYVSH